MTTDEAIAQIEQILEYHCPGSYDEGLKMVYFLREKAQQANEAVQDAMSARDE